MKIRETNLNDLSLVMDIYAYAREQMKKNGNPTQWGDSRPSQETIEEDILNKNSFVIVDDEDRICGVFTFIIGADPTYADIYDGKWLNDEPYGVIHRIASDGSSRGILEAALSCCEPQIDNIRIDTHHDNKIMQHLLEKHGFIRCGIIYVDDGTPRIAYQKNRG
jgi:predicted GNAT family N-acyltransferase